MDFIINDIINDIINNIVNDIINQIVTNKIIFIFRDNSIYISNIDRFKYNHRLDGANVFKMLFNLKKDSSFANLPIITENGYVTLLRDLNISQYDWILFENFITKEIIPGYNSLSIKYKTDLFLECIEKINIVCSKLGGIPFFDEYYIKIMNNHEPFKNEVYHPLKPEEDYLDKYNWMILNSTSTINTINFIGSHVKSNNGWSATYCSKTDNSHGNMYFFRKKK